MSIRNNCYVFSIVKIYFSKVAGFTEDNPLSFIHHPDLRRIVKTKLKTNKSIKSIDHSISDLIKQDLVAVGQIALNHTAAPDT